jgi:putative transposase
MAKGDASLATKLKVGRNNSASSGGARFLAVYGRFMPRHPRVIEPHAVYHVTARGNRRGPIFMDDGDRAFFLRLFRQTVRRCGWRPLAYCLLTNHYHLLFWTAAEALPVGMRQLNAVHAMAFNERHTLEGHLFQDRYGSKLVKTQEHLLQAYRYIAMNPVRAGLCRRPEDWRWSSYAAELRGEPVLPGAAEVLLLFDSEPGSALRRLRLFVADAPDLA